MTVKLTGRVVLVVVLLWLLAAAADVASLYLGDAEGATSDWSWVWYKRLIVIPYWVAVSLLALRYFGAHEVKRDNLGWHALVTLLAGSVVSFGFVCALSAAIAARAHVPWMPLVFDLGLPATMLYGGLKAGEIVLAALAYCYYQRTNARDRERRELQLQLARTELLLFRSQLEPHFLFNTLNSIAALIRLSRHDAAIEAIHQLSKLLRHVLDVGSQQCMPFGWEAAFTNLYVDLQRLRFGEKLQVHFAPAGIPSSVPVPIMLLQPLIENAINHGPLTDAQPCEVFVEMSHQQQRLQVEVRNVIGRNLRPREGGVGLKNIEGRLRALYGDDFAFSCQRAAGAFVVRLEFPAVEAAA